nr:NADH dehydrogenase subunit 3 [Azana sp. WQY005]
MLLMLLMSMIIMIISMLMMLISSIISKKSFSDREKMSPFECGFDPKSSSRLPFSLQFFLITIIFLIFDVEIVLLLPVIIVMKFSMMYTWMMTTIFFLMILLIGLYHEWKMGALNWSS